MKLSIGFTKVKVDDYCHQQNTINTTRNLCVHRNLSQYFRIQQLCVPLVSLLLALSLVSKALTFGLFKQSSSCKSDEEPIASNNMKIKQNVAIDKLLHSHKELDWPFLTSCTAKSGSFVKRSPVCSCFTLPSPVHRCGSNNQLIINMAEIGASRMVCIADFESFAFKTLDRNALDYYRSGADDEVTLKDNMAAFKRWRLVPRVLVDVSQRDMRCIILGHRVAFPVCIAPTAMHRMAHPDGEVATAKAAAAMDTAYTLSTIATSSIEEVAAGSPSGLRFFQLYIYKDRKITLELIKRAELHGYKALILTVDTPFFGKRLADNRNKFKLPSHLKMANFEKMDFKGSGVNQSREQSGLNEYANSLFDQSLTWKDVKWLKSKSSLPVVLKGILTAEDARIAADHGIDGIVVSNHGARQLDTVPATIDVLPAIVRAVAGRCEVYLDGGVRTGSDILKALALGARAVFIGRPAIYGLAYNGEDGVKQVLHILKEELNISMALAGCTNLSAIDKSLVIHESRHQSRL